MQGEIKITVDENGVRVGASPSLASNLLVLLGLLDVARETFHQQARQAQQKRPVFPPLGIDLSKLRGES